MEKKKIKLLVLSILVFVQNLIFAIFPFDHDIIILKIFFMYNLLISLSAIQTSIDSIYEDHVYEFYMNIFSFITFLKILLIFLYPTNILITMTMMQVFIHAIIWAA